MEKSNFELERVPIFFCPWLRHWPLRSLAVAPTDTNSKPKYLNHPQQSPIALYSREKVLIM